MAPRCKIVWFTVPDGPPYYATGPQRAMSQCMTHQWSDVPGITQNLPDGQGLCPIGRIEEATEAALAKIEQKARETNP